MNASFIPKSWTLLRKGYTKELFAADLKAGITIGFISLPLVMAYAISSGVTPERGLYTAIVAGFLISLFGGSRFQIGGPTGAYVVIVYAVVQKHGYEGLALATLLAGSFLILAGLCRVGCLIRFIPHPVITGFTAGIATVIFVTQIKDFAGFEFQNASPHFLNKLIEYSANLQNINPIALLSPSQQRPGLILFNQNHQLKTTCSYYLHHARIVGKPSPIRIAD